MGRALAIGPGILKAESFSAMIWKRTGTPDRLSMWKVLDSWSPAFVFPKFRNSVDTLTSGLTALPRQHNDTAFPLAVVNTNVSEEKTPEALGV